jgi:cytoskeletal protein CcmA (bactofilin family)
MNPSSGASGAIIGPTMHIEGEVYAKDDIQIDGEVKGSVRSDNRLTIGESGKADAAINAGEVVVAGTVNGNIDATRRIVLRKGAHLVGDVRTAGIVIEDGAYFRGGIDITHPSTGPGM